MTVVGIARARRPLRALAVSIHSRGPTGRDERASHIFNHRLLWVGEKEESTRAIVARAWDRPAEGGWTASGNAAGWRRKPTPPVKRRHVRLFELLFDSILALAGSPRAAVTAAVRTRIFGAAISRAVNNRLERNAGPIHFPDETRIDICFEVAPLESGNRPFAHLNVRLFAGGGGQVGNCHLLVNANVVVENNRRVDVAGRTCLLSCATAENIHPRKTRAETMINR